MSVYPDGQRPIVYSVFPDFLFLGWPRDVVDENMNGGESNGK